MLHRCFVALALLMLAAPAFAFEGRQIEERAPITAETSTPQRLAAPARVRATGVERSRYAAREAASPEARQYRGGDDVVIISASALAVVLAVVLLIVLL
jgi:hypothetical protein